MFQVRRKTPRAGNRDPFYNPERDLAYAGPELIRQAMYTFDELLAKEPWFAAYMYHFSLDEDMILEGAKRFAAAMQLVVVEKDFNSALLRAGFHKLPGCVQSAFYIVIGRIFLSATWAGVKDVSGPQDEPPISMQELANDVEIIRQQMYGEHDVEPDPVKPQPPANVNITEGSTEVTTVITTEPVPLPSPTDSTETTVVQTSEASAHPNTTEATTESTT